MSAWPQTWRLPAILSPSGTTAYVGQNKSNTTLKLECLLSLLLYKRVLIIYFIPGHSHMIADQVVSWAKRSLATQNLYLPSEIIERMKAVKGLQPHVIDHEDAQRPAFSGFKPFLDKYFKDLPPRFTQNYVFEFYDGKVRMQHLVTTPDSEAEEYELCSNPEATVKAACRELFGVDHLPPGFDPRDIRLPRTPVTTLEAAKVKSLQKKYDTIPESCLHYYPQPLAAAVPEEEGEQPAAGTVLQDVGNLQARPQRKRTQREKTTPVAPGARVPAPTLKDLLGAISERQLMRLAICVHARDTLDLIISSIRSSSIQVFPLHADLGPAQRAAMIDAFLQPGGRMGRWPSETNAHASTPLEGAADVQGASLPPGASSAAEAQAWDSDDEGGAASLQPPLRMAPAQIAQPLMAQPPMASPGGDGDRSGDGGQQDAAVLGGEASPGGPGGAEEIPRVLLQGGEGMELLSSTGVAVGPPPGDPAASATAANAAACAANSDHAASAENAGEAGVQREASSGAGDEEALMRARAAGDVYQLVGAASPHVRVRVLAVTESALPTGVGAEPPLGLSLLINYDIPMRKENYTKRVLSTLGTTAANLIRTADSMQRPEVVGGFNVVTFLTGADVGALRALEASAGIVLQEMPIHEVPIHL
eukprot:jgi/Mesvir1/7148/Mv02508-RA.1